MSEQGEAFDLVVKMIDALNANVVEGMDEFWAPDMTWYGPMGMGVQTSLAEWERQLAAQFEGGFPQHYADDRIRFGCGQWAAAHGHQHMRHRGDWLGIPGTEMAVQLRYMDIWRSENGKLIENWVLVDIIDFLDQIGIDALQLVRDAIARGEITLPTADPALAAEGGRPDPSFPVERRGTASGEAVELVEGMIDALNETDVEGMDPFWATDMRWYGPMGMGTHTSLADFQENLQKPFRHAFPHKFADDEIRMGCGQWAAAHGYQHTFHDGDWLGIPATGLPVKLRYMDIWRAQDGKLVENWVLVDIVEFLDQIGIDVLQVVRDAIARGDVKLQSGEQPSAPAMRAVTAGRL